MPQKNIFEKNTYPGSTPKENRQLINWFLKLKIKDYHSSLQKRSESFFKKRSDQHTLALFHQASRRVPAYADFLKKSKINPKNIKTIEHFKKVPLINKKNYISKYPLESISWDGKLSNKSIVSYSSGSTGLPFYWPRGVYQEIEGALLHEHLLTSIFGVDEKSTLVVICFSLGNYVAGTFTLESTKYLQTKGHPVTVVTPGLNFDDIFETINKLSPMYDQTIICGYPPFIKDILDIGKVNGINWKKIKMKFLLASEFYSENFRDYLIDHTGAENPFMDTTNIYGAAEATLFGFETPLTTLIRRKIRNKPEIGQELFASDLTPTLVQYNPALRYFEKVNRELVLTAAAGIPLIRYNLQDLGGILSLTEIKNIFNKYGINLLDNIKENNLEKTVTNLPFVYLTGRTDSAVSFYGVLIYPEYIKDALEEKSLSKRLSGKFTLVVKYNKNQDPYLEINVELNPKIRPTNNLKKIVQEKTVKHLEIRCSEYSFLNNSIKSKAEPKIVLHNKASSEYFKLGIKQKWVKK